MARNPSYVIEIETHLTDIKDQIKKYERDLRGLQDTANNMGIGDSVAKEIQQAIEVLNKLQSEYVESVKKFSNTKLDSSEFDNFTKTIDSRMQQVSGIVVGVEERISELSSKIDNFKMDKLISQVKGVRNQMSNFRKDMKGAVDLLKDFQNLTSQYSGEKELRSLLTTLDKIGQVDLTDLKGVSATKKQLKSLEAQLDETYSRFTMFKETLSDKNSSPTMIKNAEKEMANLIPEISEIIKKIATINGIDPINFEQFFTGLEIKTAGSPLDVDEILKEIDSDFEIIQQRLKSRRDELQSEVEKFKTGTTEVNTFTFEDGGIKVPVVLSQESINKCKEDLNELVAILQRDTKPVEVFIKLSALKTEKLNSSELSKYIKDIKAQIPKDASDELKTSVNKLVKNFDHEYQNSLKLNIKFNLSDSVESVEKKVKLITDRIKKLRPTISPNFDIDPEEVKKINSKFDDIRGEFNFDLTGQLTDLTEQLNKLLNESDPSKWSESFKRGLNNLKPDIEELSTLVQPLVQLTSNKSKNRVGRPSKQDLEDRSYVEKFTSAVNSLNKALSIYDKKLKYSGSIASELTDGVQGEIDKSGEYVTVPVRPDVNGFMDELEDSLNDLKINVNLGNVTTDGATTESSGTVTTTTTTTTTTKSKTKKSDNTTAETKPKSKYLSKDTDGMDDEFKNVFFGGKTKNGKYKKIRLGTKEEKTAINEINSAMSTYLSILRGVEREQKNIEKLDPLSDPSKSEEIAERIKNADKYFEDASKKMQELEDKYPMLKNISGKKNLTHYEKDNIRDEYLSSKGIKRTAQYHESSYFDSLRDEVSKKGKFNLKEAGNKEALTDIVSRYLGYKNRGGTRTLDDLTDNSAVLQKLRKKYDELTGSVSRTTKAKNEYTNATGKETSSNIYEQQSTAQLKQKYEELANYKKTLNEQLDNSDYLKGVGQAKEEIQQETTSLSKVLKAYQNNKKIYNKKKKDNAEDAEEYKKNLIESTENNLKNKYGLTSDDLKGFSKFSSKKIDELSQELVGRRQVLKELSKTENQMNTISSILDNRKNSTDDISKETSEIKENTKAKQTNNDETKKQKQTKTNKQSDVEEIKQETTALKENTKAKESNNKVELTKTQKTDAKKMLSKSRKKQSQINKNKNTLERSEEFESLKSFTSSLGNLDFRKTGMKDNLDSVLKQYQDYVDKGGKRSITDLTDNENAQKKLKEAYEKTTAAIKEQTSEKNKNNKPVVEEIQEEVNARQKNVNVAKEETDAVNKSNQAKEELTIRGLDDPQRIKDAQDFKSSNKKYSKLSDEYVVRSKLPNETYDTESMDSMLKKRAEAVKIKDQIVKFSKENIDNITDSDIEKLSELDSKYGEIVKGLSNIDYTSIVDLKEINSEYNKAFDIISDKIEENSKKQGESYAEGIESTKSQAEQAGADLAKAANEGTADAQQSHSPSKVAEALGEYWGIGYAKGIKKHKGDVEDAVKELVSTGVLTTENLQEDFTKLTNGEYGNKYKALYEPLNNILNVDDTDAKKIITSAKGQITKITNQLSNIDNIEDLDKADSNINKWLNKLEELGYDTSTFEKKYVLVRKEVGKTFGSAFTRITSETKASVQDLQQESEKTTDLIERLGGIVDVYRQVQKKTTKTGYENAISYRLVGENGYAWVGANGDILKENIKKSSAYTDDTKSQKEQLKERQKNEELALKYHLQALEKESAAEKEAYNNKMAIRQEWLKKAQEETARKANEPTFKDKWDESLSQINKDQHKTLQNIFKEQIQTSSKDVFKNYHDKDGNWTGALADDALAEAEERQKIIDERNANYEKVLSTYKELLSAQKELNTLTKRNEETSGIYSDELKECESTLQRLRGEVREIGESGIIDSFSEEQIQELSGVVKNIEDTERSQAAHEQVEESKQAYEELGSKVKEYIKLRKIIAQGKALDGDVDKAEKLKSEIDELNNSLNESPLFNASRQAKAMSGMDTIDEEVNRINQAQQEKLSKTFQGISSRLDSASYDVGFEIKNGNQTEEFKQRLISIKQQIDDINNKPINAITQSDIDEGTRLLEQVRQIRKEGKLTENTKANENSVQKGLAQINSILSENTKLSFRNTDVYKDLVNLKKEFQTFDTNRPQAELAELTTSFLKVKARFEDLENTFKGKNLFQTFVERLHGTTAQLIAQYLSFQDIIRYARTIVSTIIDLDTQLVDLRKTTKMNTDELNDFYSSASNVSKQLGVTTSEIISQAAAWSRLGYNTKEASTEMAKLSSQFASISPGMDTESATDTLVSTMQAYKIGVDDVQRTVMDNINAIGNSMATTNEEIGEMLQRSSAAMKAANNSLEETIALESAAVEITRNAETTGTAFRTISMRIRGKQSLPPYSENYMLCA